MLEEQVASGRLSEGRSYSGSPLVRETSDERIVDPSKGISRGEWVPAHQSQHQSVRQNGNSGALAAIAYSPSYKKSLLTKQAATVSTTGGMGAASSAGSSVERLAPEVYSPLFTMANLNLPRDRITVNAWCRNFYDLHPIVRNAITLHATYPISKLDIKCADKKVEDFFRDMVEEMDLLGAIGNIALEYWKLGECVPGDSDITTSEGRKKAYEIKEGDLVLTHEGRFMSVEKRLLNWKHKEVLHIKARCCPEDLVVSGNHPVYALRTSSLSGYKKRCHVVGGIVRYKNESEWSREWVSASDIERGDLLVIPVNRREEDDQSKTASWCRMLGLWLAEGCFARDVSSSSPKAPIITNFDERIWKDYEDVFSDCGMRLSKSGASGNGYLRSTAKKRASTIEEAEKILRDAGQYSHLKRLSKKMMLLPPKKQLEIVAGFADGDGWISKGAISMGTVSRHLVIQMKEILARNWILSSIHVDRRSKRDLERRDLYVLSIPGFYANRLALCSRLSAKLAEQRNGRPLRPNNIPRQRFAADGHILSPVISVSRKSLLPGEPLFNFEVMEDNSYCSNGFAVHNCFPYAELDENTGKWRKVIVQNPDYIHVKKTVVASEPIISLRPDAVLQRLITSNNPADIQLRKQIPEEVLFHVRKGHNIPLDNFNVSHLKLLSSPYDVRGTSVIVSIFKDLMLYDKLRECFSMDTEVLTEDGFKEYGNITSEDKIATFNPMTEELEYHSYISRLKRRHEGKMYRFHGKKIDLLVTPGHRMWFSKYSKNGYSPFEFVEAQDVVRGAKYRSRAVVGWKGEEPEYMDLCGVTVPTEEYVRFLGYSIAEASVRFEEGAGGYCVSMSQSENSKHIDNMRKLFKKVCSKRLGMHSFEVVTKNEKGFSARKTSLIRHMRCTRKALAAEMAGLIGTKAAEKRIPAHVKCLSPRLLRILLECMVAGDGHVHTGGWRGKTTTWSYSTISKRLADDVHEVAFKAGFAPILKLTRNGQGKEYWYISFSLDSGVGSMPLISDKIMRGGKINVSDYSGDVFCFEVPHNLLVVRRNGKISIQGNCKFAQADSLVNPITLVKIGGSAEGEYHPTDDDLQFWRNIIEEAQYDKDFKIVTHAGMTIERVGSSGAVLDIGSDIELIIKNIFWGLMVPQAVVDSESAVYASASIGLEVLRQRYFNFRNMLAKWMVNKIFAPISEIQGFYEYKDGEKRLIVPEVEWNHMNLYDLQDYVSNISSLVTSKQASLQTLYRSLGLNYKDERKKLREEFINDAISQREQSALAGMSLQQLRGLDSEQDIMEPLPGEEQSEVAGGGMGAVPGGEMGMGGEMGGFGGGMSGGGGGMGGLPELGPPAPGGEMGGAGAPPGGGATPSLGPGTPGGPGGAPPAI